MTVEFHAICALLLGWAKWKRSVDTTHEYLSPPNLIYRLMVGDVSGGGGFGSVEPMGVRQSKKHNPIFHRLDCVIGELSKRLQETIYCEFFVAGSRESKAQMMGIGLRGYLKNLNSALKHILNDSMIENLINQS